jgi:hypothetical protein
MRPSDQELLARRAALIKRELTEQPERWWWLSFANEKGFLGAVVVRAHGFVTAIELARLMGINPGGECQGAEIPEPEKAGPPYPEQFANRLLSREEIEAKLGIAKWG